MTHYRCIKTTLPLALLVTLMGCSTVATSTVVTNSDGVLAAEFTPAQLPGSVRAVIEKGEALPKRFSRVEFTAVANFEEDGKKLEIKENSVLIDLGNGYIQTRDEFARNDVPYRVNLALNFAGAYSLRNQTTFLNRQNSQNPFETKEMLQFDRGIGKPKSGASYTIESRRGGTIQLMNFTEQKQLCIAGAATAASALHPSLSGSAIPLDCTVYGNNGVVSGKVKYLWVAMLGVSFEIEESDARSTAKYKIESIKVQL